MSDSPGSAKRDGSAFKAHMEGLKARNDAARKAGKQEREEHEESQRVDRSANDKRQAAALRSSDHTRGK
jgi:hypothetical protein